MREANFPIRIQMVVHSLNYNHAYEIFHYFHNILNIKQLAICPCFYKNSLDKLSKLCLKNKEYTQFLIELFDIWIKHYMPFRVNLFYNIFRLMKYKRNSLCYLTGNCSSINITNSGDVYCSCEVQTKETYLGNIIDNRLDILYQKYLERLNGLTDTELVHIMNRDYFNTEFQKEKICYQYGYQGFYYYLESIWKLYRHVYNIIGKYFAMDWMP